MALQEEFESQGNYLFRHRGTFPIIILVIGYVVFLQTKLNEGMITEKSFFRENIYLYLCLAVSLLGLFIRIYTVGHTPANTSGRNTTGQLADTLNTSGIYSIVRHPLYVGNFFMWFGISLLTYNLWFNISFVFIYWVYYERIMYAEEQFLRGKFGPVYTSWAAETPAFIPRFSQFEKPNLRFSWKKVVKKEKNGLVALFIIFYLFYFTGCMINNREPDNYFLAYACVFSIVIYLILKYIKKYTKLLDEEGR